MSTNAPINNFWWLRSLPHFNASLESNPDCAIVTSLITSATANAPEQFHLSCKLDKDVYTAGETITGCVYIYVDKNFPCQRVTIYFKGVCFLKLSNDIQTGKLIFIKASTWTPKGQNKYIPLGISVLRFTLELPKNLRSTALDNEVGVVYALTADFEQAGLSANERLHAFVGYVRVYSLPYIDKNILEAGLSSVDNVLVKDSHGVFQGKLMLMLSIPTCYVQTNSLLNMEAFIKCESIRNKFKILEIFPALFQCIYFLDQKPKKHMRAIIYLKDQYKSNFARRKKEIKHKFLMNVGDILPTSRDNDKKKGNRLQVFYVLALVIKHEHAKNYQVLTRHPIVIVHKETYKSNINPYNSDERMSQDIKKDADPSIQMSLDFKETDNEKIEEVKTKISKLLSFTKSDAQVYLSQFLPHFESIIPLLRDFISKLVSTLFLMPMGMPDIEDPKEWNLIEEWMDSFRELLAKLMAGISMKDLQEIFQNYIVDFFKPWHPGKSLSRRPNIAYQNILRSVIGHLTEIILLAQSNLDSVTKTEQTLKSFASVSDKECPIPFVTCKLWYGWHSDNPVVKVHRPIHVKTYTNKSSIIELFMPLPTSNMAKPLLLPMDFIFEWVTAFFTSTMVADSELEPVTVDSKLESSTVVESYLISSCGISANLEPANWDSEPQAKIIYHTYINKESCTFLDNSDKKLSDQKHKTYSASRKKPSLPLSDNLPKCQTHQSANASHDQLHQTEQVQAFTDTVSKNSHSREMSQTLPDFFKELPTVANPEAKKNLSFLDQPMKVKDNTSDKAEGAKVSKNQTDNLRKFKKPLKKITDARKAMHITNSNSRISSRKILNASRSLGSLNSSHKLDVQQINSPSRDNISALSNNVEQSVPASLNESSNQKQNLSLSQIDTYVTFQANLATQLIHIEDVVKTAHIYTEINLQKVPADSDVPVAPADSDVPVAPADSDVPIAPADSDVPVAPADSDVPLVPANRDVPLVSDDGDESVIPADGDESAVPADRDIPAAPANKDVSLVFNDSHESVASAGGDESVVPADGDESVVPADGDESIVPADGDESVGPADGDESVGPADGDESIVPADGHESVVPADEDEPVVPVDEVVSVVPADGDESVGPADGDESVGPADGDESVGPADGDESVGPANGDESIGPSDGDESVGPSDGDESVGPSDGDESVGSSDGDESVGSSDGDKSVGSSDGDESVGSSDSDESVAPDDRDVPLVPGDIGVSIFPTDSESANSTITNLPTCLPLLCTSPVPCKNAPTVSAHSDLPTFPDRSNTSALSKKVEPTFRGRSTLTSQMTNERDVPDKLDQDIFSSQTDYENIPSLKLVRNELNIVRSQDLVSPACQTLNTSPDLLNTSPEQASIPHHQNLSSTSPEPLRHISASCLLDSQIKQRTSFLSKDISQINSLDINSTSQSACTIKQFSECATDKLEKVSTAFEKVKKCRIADRLWLLSKKSNLLTQTHRTAVNQEQKHVQEIADESKKIKTSVSADITTKFHNRILFEGSTYDGKSLRSNSKTSQVFTAEEIKADFASLKWHEEPEHQNTNVDTIVLKTNNIQLVQTSSKLDKVASFKYQNVSAGRTHNHLVLVPIKDYKPVDKHINHSYQLFPESDTKPKNPATESSILYKPEAVGRSRRHLEPETRYKPQQLVVEKKIIPILVHEPCEPSQQLLPYSVIRPHRTLVHPVISSHHMFHPGKVYHKSLVNSLNKHQIHTKHLSRVKKNHNNKKREIKLPAMCPEILDGQVMKYKTLKESTKPQLSGSSSETMPESTSCSEGPFRVPHFEKEEEVLWEQNIVHNINLQHTGIWSHGMHIWTSNFNFGDSQSISSRPSLSGPQEWNIPKPKSSLNPTAPPFNVGQDARIATHRLNGQHLKLPAENGLKRFEGELKLFLNSQNITALSPTNQNAEEENFQIVSQQTISQNFIDSIEQGAANLFKPQTQHYDFYNQPFPDGSWPFQNYSHDSSSIFGQKVPDSVYPFMEETIPEPFQANSEWLHLSSGQISTDHMQYFTDFNPHLMPPPLQTNFLTGQLAFTGLPSNGYQTNFILPYARNF